MTRYMVVKGSQSAHCCFDATVVDTHKLTGYKSAPFEAVCETFDVDDAKMICEALNAKEEHENK